MGVGCGSATTLVFLEELFKILCKGGGVSDDVIGECLESRNEERDPSYLWGGDARKQRTGGEELPRGLDICEIGIQKTAKQDFSGASAGREIDSVGVQV